MKNRPLFLAGILSEALVFGMALGECVTGGGSSKREKTTTAIHFMGFPWEDAVILESRGKFALVDAGEPGRAEYIADYLIRLAKKDAVELEFIIATHMHIDHAGGLVGNDEYAGLIGGGFGITVKKIFYREYDEKSLKGDLDSPDHWYGELQRLCIENNIEIVKDNNILKNHVIDFGKMKITLMFNGSGIPPNCDLNAESITQYIEIGRQKVLLAADQCRNAGDFLLDNIKQVSGGNGQIDILKLGHHGIHGTGVDGIINILQPSTIISTNTGEELNTPPPAPRSNALRIIRSSTDAMFFTAYDSGGVKIKFTANGHEVTPIGERHVCGEAGCSSVDKTLIDWVLE